MSKIKRAILSCYDKTGIVELAELLVSMEVEIISTSGTLKVLQDAGIPAKSISEFTGVPELLDGRVKSLHWKVHAGLLGIRDKKLHMEQMQEHGLEWAREMRGGTGCELILSDASHVALMQHNYSNVAK